jgi:hypothetical protein
MFSRRPGSRSTAGAELRARKEEETDPTHSVHADFFLLVSMFNALTTSGR